MKGEIALAHLSDLHFGYGKSKHAERAWSLLEEILREVKPSLLLISGDLVDTPKRKYFDDAIQKLQALDVPYYACLGNHDWHRNGNRLDHRLTFGRVWFRTACTVLWLATALASYHGIGWWALGFVALAATPWVGPWVICWLWNSVGTNLFDAEFAKRILGPKTAIPFIYPDHRDPEWKIGLLGLDSSVEANVSARRLRGLDAVYTSPGSNPRARLGPLHLPDPPPSDPDSGARKAARERPAQTARREQPGQLGLAARGDGSCASGSVVARARARAQLGDLQ